MAETTKRPDVEILIVWNEDTGAFDIKFENAHVTQVIGLLSFGAHVLAGKMIAFPTDRGARIVHPSRTI